MYQERTSKCDIWYMKNGSKVYVGQKCHLRPLASETTSQSKILGLAAEEFISYKCKLVDMSRQHTS
jgi:hypothetical protein